jgi:hypothetical protein
MRLIVWNRGLLHIDIPDDVERLTSKNQCVALVHKLKGMRLTATNDERHSLRLTPNDGIVVGIPISPGCYRRFRER